MEKNRQNKSKKEKRRVVVTGLGCLTPIGNDVDAYWDNALKGVSGIDSVANFDASNFPSKIAGEVKGFKTPKVVYKKGIAKYMNRACQLGIEAACMAIEDAGLSTENSDHERVGISVGISGYYPDLDVLRYCYDFRKDDNWDYRRFAASGRVSPCWIFNQGMANVLPCMIAKLFKFGGPNLVCQSACASGAHAIGEAFRMIKRGDADVVVSGGSDSLVTTLEMTVFMLLYTLSTRKCQPEEASCPFDEKRDGFVMSEGAAMLVLEELNHALKRNAKIYAEIIGYGTSCNAFRITDTPLDGEAPALAIKRAFDAAGVSPTDIDYINAHGTSTQQNDIAETTAIKGVFDEYAYQIPVTAVKSFIGHTISASGPIGLLTSILAHKHDAIPPTINLKNPDPYCDLDYVPNKMRKKVVSYAITNAFGFGGQNVCIVTKKLDETK